MYFYIMIQKKHLYLLNTTHTLQHKLYSWHIIPSSAQPHCSPLPLMRRDLLMSSHTEIQISFDGLHKMGVCRKRNDVRWK